MRHILRGAVCVALALPAVARAQAAAPVPALRASPWALGVVAAGGAMLTDDQRAILALGGGGGFARIELRARPFDDLGIDWIETDLRGSFTIAGPGIEGHLGGLLDVALGARLTPTIGDVRLYAEVAFGLGLTGPLARPVGSGAIGVAWPVTDEVMLGPELDVQHVIQWDGPGQSSDAVFLAVAAALTYRPRPHPDTTPDEPAPRPVERQRAPRPPPAPAFERAPPEPPTSMTDLAFLMDEAVCGEREDVITLLPPVLFDHDQAVLSAAGEVAMHDVLARVMEAPDDARVLVEGHADVTGTSDYNELLAFERAEAVVAWLVAHGASRARIEETGHGERRPLVGGDTVEALAPNRRVTIRIERSATPDHDAREAP